VTAATHPDKLTVKRERLRDLVAPDLQDGETIVAILGSACGPMSPFTPMIPVWGAIAVCTRRFRTYGLVVTDRRLLLVRKWQVGSRPRCVDIAAPLAATEVIEWKIRQSYGTLTLRVDGREVRLHVSGAFLMDVPSVLVALGVRA
jgi:hypothetical protein